MRHAVPNDSIAAFLDKFHFWMEPEFRKNPKGGLLHGDLILLEVVLLLTTQTELCDVTYQPSGKFQLFRESRTTEDDIIDLHSNYMHSKIFHEEQACTQAECHLSFFKNLVFTYQKTVS